MFSFSLEKYTPLFCRLFASHQKDYDDVQSCCFFFMGMMLLLLYRKTDEKGQVKTIYFLPYLNSLPHWLDIQNNTSIKPTTQWSLERDWFRLNIGLLITRGDTYTDIPIVLIILFPCVNISITASEYPRNKFWERRNCSIGLSTEFCSQGNPLRVASLDKFRQGHTNYLFILLSTKHKASGTVHWLTV